jgi:preprotein translocase subunit YajC
MATLISLVTLCVIIMVASFFLTFRKQKEETSGH